MRFQVDLPVRDRLTWQKEQMYYVEYDESVGDNYPWHVKSTGNGTIRRFRQDNVQSAIACAEALQAGFMLDSNSPAREVK